MTHKFVAGMKMTSTFSTLGVYLFPRTAIQ